MESSSVVQIKEEPREEIVLDEEEGTVSCRPSVDISIDSLNYSDAEDQSWHSPYDSNGGTYDEYDYSSGSDLEPAEATDQPTKVSVVDESEVDLEKGPDEPNRPEPVAQPNQGPRIVRSVSKAEKDCRICHLSLATAHEAGTSIVLGCSCKADLAAAHKQCAEAWFKIRGNRTCEICGSTARNVVGIDDSDFMDQWNEGNSAPPPVAETRNFWRGHRFLNFLLACMVFAFVISWLFHFNIPS